MNFDVLFLSRLQFALTIGSHFLFPPLSMGLAWLLTYIEWRGWKGNNKALIRAGKPVANPAAGLKAMMPEMLIFSTASLDSET
ncbi:MAG: cytochrome ubiquinol oxidase subunit I [candidate division Zixibacteria bacterium]|nr:cytochrome ubiquinol oxidase subunit I [candidate division Zixibacteria bacterium]